MKNIKHIILILLVIITNSCSLEEEPPFLNRDNVFDTNAVTVSAVNAMYASITAFNYYGADFMFVTNLFSGFTVTRRGGPRNTNLDNSTLASLDGAPSGTQLNNVWRAIYVSVSRSNDIIQGIEPVVDPITEIEITRNEALGHAYFVRAFNYFNLVNLWGEVPLRLSPSTTETLNLAASPIGEIYAQIISDLENSQRYRNGSIVTIAPRVEATNMLFAKVYMALATAPENVQADAQPGTTSLQFWQLAYDQAIQVYSNYQLLPSYTDLFTGIAGNNTVESIFEAQSIETISIDHRRAFTPNFYTRAFTFGWLVVNPEIYDMHLNTYPDDERLSINYLLEWQRSDNGSFIRNYRARANINPNNPNIPLRPRFAVAFPFLFKLAEKDQSVSSQQTNVNFKIYRYADLLLMLSEISNELQNGEQLIYVTEVLDRVNITPSADYTSGDQETFRAAIMREYQFELMGEGHDWYNNRRRGFDFFRDNVILPHNNGSLFNAAIDVTHNENENTAMFLPIPDRETNLNNLIDPR